MSKGLAQIMKQAQMMQQKMAELQEEASPADRRGDCRRRSGNRSGERQESDYFP